MEDIRELRQEIRDVKQLVVGDGTSCKGVLPRVSALEGRARDHDEEIASLRSQLLVLSPQIMVLQRLIEDSVAESKENKKVMQALEVSVNKLRGDIGGDQLVKNKWIITIIVALALAVLALIAGPDIIGKLL